VKKPAKRQSLNPSTTTSAKTSKNTEEPPSKKPKEEKAPEEGKKEKVVEEEEEEEEKKNEQVVVKEEVEEKKDEKMEVTSTEVSAEPTQPQASVEPSTLSSEEAKESPDHQKTEVRGLLPPLEMNRTRTPASWLAGLRRLWWLLGLTPVLNFSTLGRKLESMI